MPLAKRALPQPVLTFSPRSIVETSTHSVIDAYLKNLKVISRRLQSSYSTFRDEYSLLERLFYKGKNQHRSARFWKRTSEVRRYCARLDELHLPDMLESLRCSFFGTSAAPNAKTLKGSWTHLPNKPFLLYVSERFLSSSKFVEKMHHRFTEAYLCLTVSMQSGYFIQLLTTLVAIVSRMSFLLPEFLEIFQVASTSCDGILRLLDSVPKEMHPEIRSGTRLSGEVPLDVLGLEEKFEVASEGSHDVRLSSTRDAVPDDGPSFAHGFSYGNELSESDTSFKKFETAHDMAISSSRNPSSLSGTVPTSQNVNRSRVKKKKRERTWDEIDEIFGF